jgi:hypothetical protein
MHPTQRVEVYFRSQRETSPELPHDKYKYGISTNALSTRSFASAKAKDEKLEYTSSAGSALLEAQGRLAVNFIKAQNLADGCALDAIRPPESTR